MSRPIDFLRSIQSLFGGRPIVTPSLSDVTPELTTPTIDHTEGDHRIDRADVTIVGDASRSESTELIELSRSQQAAADLEATQQQQPQQRQAAATTTAGGALVTTPQVGGRSSVGGTSLRSDSCDVEVAGLSQGASDGMTPLTTSSTPSADDDAAKHVRASIDPHSDSCAMQVDCAEESAATDTISLTQHEAATIDVSMTSEQEPVDATQEATPTAAPAPTVYSSSQPEMSHRSSSTPMMESPMPLSVSTPHLTPARSQSLVAPKPFRHTPATVAAAAATNRMSPAPRIEQMVASSPIAAVTASPTLMSASGRPAVSRALVLPSPRLGATALSSPRPAAMAHIASPRIDLASRPPSMAPANLSMSPVTPRPSPLPPPPSLPPVTPTPRSAPRPAGTRFASQPSRRLLEFARHRSRGDEEWCASLDDRNLVEEWRLFLQRVSPGAIDGSLADSVRAQAAEQLRERDEQLEDVLLQMAEERRTDSTRPTADEEELRPWVPTKEDQRQAMIDRLPAQINILVHATMADIESFSTILADHVRSDYRDPCRSDRKLQAAGETIDLDDRANTVDPGFEAPHVHEGVCAQRAHIDRQVDAGYHADASRARDDAESGTHPKKPIKMRYERALYLAAGGHLRCLNAQVKGDMCRQLQFTDLLWNFYIDTGHMRVLLRLMPDREECGVPLIDEQHLGDLISFGGIVHSLGPVEIGSRESGNSWPQPFHELRECHDSSPAQTMPYQTVVVTPTVLDRRRTSSETAVSGDTDDGVARVEVDIDGELTGSFAVGDEVACIGRLQYAARPRLRTREDYDAQRAAESDRPFLSTTPRSFLVQANNLVLTHDERWVNGYVEELLGFRQLLQDAIKSVLPRLEPTHGCNVTDWSLTEMMCQFFCLDAVPGMLYPLLKLQILLSLVSGGYVEATSTHTATEDSSDIKSESLYSPAVRSGTSIGAASSSVRVESRGLNLLVLTDASSCEDVRRMLHSASQVMRIAALHTVRPGNESAPTLPRLLPVLGQGTLLCVTSEQQLSRAETNRLVSQLFPPPPDPCARTGTRGGRGGGRGGRRTRDDRPDPTNAIYIGIHEEVPPSRTKPSVRHTWLHAQIGREAAPTQRADASQQQTPFLNEFDRALAERFDLVAFLDAAAMSRTTTSTSKDTPMRMRTYHILMGTNSVRPADPYEIVTNYGPEVRRHPQVRRLADLFSDNTKLNHFIEAAQSIKVAVQPEASRFWRQFANFAAARSNQPMQAYTGASRDLVLQLACAHARLHLRSDATVLDMCVGIMVNEELLALRHGPLLSALKWTRVGRALDALNIDDFRDSKIARPEATAKVFATFYHKLLRATDATTPGSVASRGAPGSATAAAAHTPVRSGSYTPRAAGKTSVQSTQVTPPSSVAPVAANSGRYPAHAAATYLTPKPTATQVGSIHAGLVTPTMHRLPPLPTRADAQLSMPPTPHSSSLATPPYPAAADVSTPIVPFGGGMTPHWSAPVSSPRDESDWM